MEIYLVGHSYFQILVDFQLSKSKIHNFSLDTTFPVGPARHFPPTPGRIALAADGHR